MAYPMPNKSFKPMAGPESSNLGQPIISSAKPKKENSKFKGLVTLIVVLIIIGGGIYLIASYTGLSNNFLSFNSNFKTEWQAVFLSNGQVYFGKIAKMTKDELVLRDIYYLQVVNQPLQRSAEGQETPAPAQDQAEQRLTLIKLGNEIHGPRDEMIINRDHVILMEDLKSDGRVVQAINDYLKQPKK